MSSIPLPALGIKPVQIANPLDQYQQALQLRNLRQQGRLQEQQVAENDNALAQQKRAAQDDEAFRSVISQLPPGATIGDALPELRGRVSAGTFLKLQEADRQLKDANAKRSKEELEARAAQQAATLPIYSAAMNLPEDQLQAQWPQIAAAYNAIPGVKQQLNPSQPLTKQQLAQFGPMFSLHESYLGAEVAKREKKAQLEKTEAETRKMNADAAAGGTTDADKYITKWLADRNLPNTAGNWLKAHQAYTKETKVDPGVARAIVYVRERPMEVPDANAPGETKIVPAREALGGKGKGSGSEVAARLIDKYFTSGKGGQTLTAFNTAISHLDALDSLASALDNGNVQIINKAGQAYAQQTGQAAPINFNAAKAAVSGEIAAAFKSSGATDQEIGQITETFKNYQSPAQLKGAINTYRTLLNSKRDNLKAQYGAGKQGQPNFGGGSGFVYARDPQGNLHKAPAGTALPAGWKQENR